MLKKIFKNNKCESDYNYELTAIMSDRTPFAVKEAVNHLCINITYLRQDDKSQCLVITSAGACEGKTALSANIARTLAKMNEHSKILFVDGDLRASGISSFLTRNESESTIKGLSEYLKGEDENVNVVSTDLENFHVVCSGAKSDNPIALMTSPKMKSFIEVCKREYDYVIFDSSPVGIVTDALLLATHVDGYIISTKADRSKVADVNEVIARIMGVNGNVIGTVLNSFNVKKAKSRKRKAEEEEIERLYGTK